MRQVYDNQTIANTSTEDNTTRPAHQHMGYITVWFTTNPGWTHGLISSLDKPLPHQFLSAKQKRLQHTRKDYMKRPTQTQQTSQADTTLVHTATHHQVDPSFVGGLQYTSRTTSLLKLIGRQQTHRLLRKQDSLQTSNTSAHTLSYKMLSTKKLLAANTYLQETTKSQQDHMIPQDSHFLPRPLSTGITGEQAHKPNGSFL